MLIILDGWGHREAREGNAIALAKTPNVDFFLQNYPHTLIDASGHAVGLPAGIMGNSEVGHLNIGAGRKVFLGLTRIYAAIEDGSFFSNAELKKAFAAAKQNKSALHLMGLVSDGAVHSHQDHLYALLQMAKREGVDQVFIHAFTDGRDTDPKSGVGFIQALEEKIAKLGVGKIATVIGRFFAMDRDKRWERTARAYQAMVMGQGTLTDNFTAAMEAAYARQETDEFLQPLVAQSPMGSVLKTIQDEDAVIFFNFRADRARQITRALMDPSFDGFERKVFPRLSCFVCMGEYDKSLALPVAFSPVHLKNIFPQIISERGLTQLRIAETEKYAHVTFFFNGGEEAVFAGESRILIPSPREVATYDLKPQMSAPEVADEAIEKINSGLFDVIILNFANADMVGHTGHLEAAIQAVEAVDTQLGRIYRAMQAKGGTMLITADHGNCEQMHDKSGKPHTAHTTDLVPLMLVGAAWKKSRLREGGTLGDIAPTLLQILKLPQPPEMSGKSLLIA